MEKFHHNRWLRIGETSRNRQLLLVKHKERAYVIAIKMMQMHEIKPDEDLKNLKREAEVHLYWTT